MNKLGQPEFIGFIFQQIHSRQFVVFVDHQFGMNKINGIAVSDGNFFSSGNNGTKRLTERLFFPYPSSNEKERCDKNNYRTIV